MALYEASYRLLQLVYVPYQQILISSRRYKRLAGATRIKRGPASARIYLCHTLICSSVPKLHQSILAWCHEHVHQILILGKRSRAMDRRDWLFMLLLIAFKRSQLACFHVQDAQGKVCVGHEKLSGEILILTYCDRVVQGTSKMCIVETLTRILHLS